MKIFRDTLMENGEYSMKRVSALAAFWLAQLYIVAVHVCDWKVLEFVYEWLMGWSFLVITGTVIDKKLMNKANLLSMPGSMKKETVETTTIKTTTPNGNTTPTKPDNDEIG